MATVNSHHRRARSSRHADTVADVDRRDRGRRPRRSSRPRGSKGLTMQRVAAAVGVRAPSLYKRVDGRGELVRLITIDVVDGPLPSARGGRVEPRPRRGPGGDRAGVPALRPRVARGVRAALPPAARGLATDLDLASPGFATLFETVGAIAGPDDRLEAARTVVAWANGFVSMELAGGVPAGRRRRPGIRLWRRAHRRSDQRAAARRATMNDMRNEALVADLRRIAGDDHVLVDPELRAGYERDWTGRYRR